LWYPTVIVHIGSEADAIEAEKATKRTTNSVLKIFIDLPLQTFMQSKLNVSMLRACHIQTRQTNVKVTNRKQ
jgi:hypothetical protein